MANSGWDRYKTMGLLSQKFGLFDRATDIKNANVASTPAEAEKRAAQIARDRIPVSFPTHLYPPEGVQTIDLAHAKLILSNTNEVLIRFVCPDGAVTILTHYAIYNDGLDEDDYEFLPTINGNRIYKFHGNPLKNFLISLGLGPDLRNDTLKMATYTMQPRDVLEWRVFNKTVGGGAVDTFMGVRVVGYVDTSTQRLPSRAGG